MIRITKNGIKVRNCRVMIIPVGLTLYNIKILDNPHIVPYEFVKISIDKNTNKYKLWYPDGHIDLYVKLNRQFKNLLKSIPEGMGYDSEEPISFTGVPDADIIPRTVFETLKSDARKEAFSDIKFYLEHGYCTSCNDYDPDDE
jgi:hypothetical protein